MRKNIYTHPVDLKSIRIKNVPRQEFAKKITTLEYRGYEVESLPNGNKIVITKPGGKRSMWGSAKKEDFLVFIFNPATSELWQISHKQILEDILAKAEENRDNAIIFLKLLERVYNGEEPDDFIDEIHKLSFQNGETPETLLKVYKWIWGQEDVNYPFPKYEGRAMSWKSLLEIRGKLIAEP